MQITAFENSLSGLESRLGSACGKTIIYNNKLETYVYCRIIMIFNTRANLIKSWGCYKRGVWGLRFGGAVITANLLPCE